jgi:O-acetylserine/cysteine efflux transporter
VTPAHVALAVVVNVIWGLTFVAAKVGIEQFSPLLFTGLRFTIVAALLAPFLRPVPIPLRPVIAVAMAAGAVHFTFLYLGIRAAGGVSAVAVTVQLIAPFSLLLAIVFLDEKVGWRRAAGIAVAFLGVMVLGFDPVVFEHLAGVGLVAVAALSMATALILMRRLRGVGVLALQGWIAVVSAPQVLLLSAIAEDGQWRAIATAGLLPVAALLFAAIATSVVAHGSWYYLLQRYPVNMMVPFGLLAPLFGVVFGVLLFDEPLSWKFLLGGAMVLTGVAVINLRGARKAAGPAIADAAGGRDGGRRE